MPPDPKRISELTEMDGNNLAAGDWFVMVDVDDPTYAASGTDKKIRADGVALTGRPYLSDTEPDGDVHPLWFDTTNGILYVWYSTTATPVWVEV